MGPGLAGRRRFLIESATREAWGHITRTVVVFIAAFVAGALIFLWMFEAAFANASPSVYDAWIFPLAVLFGACLLLALIEPNPWVITAAASFPALAVTSFLMVTHALMENRNGLLVDFEISQATGSAEREAAERLLKRQRRKKVRMKSLGADKGYDTQDFVGFLRRRKILPHVAANTERKGGSAIDGRTTRHKSYTLSQRIRKRVEEIFGWMKTVGGFRKTRFRGTNRTQLAAWWVGAAYNLIRMAKLVA